MAIEVYWGSGSPFSWRVLLTLEHKQLPYESKLLQFSKRENKTPEYLALNPRGTVPMVRDGDLVVTESIAIMAYLEQRYPERPLFGGSAAQSAKIWQRIMETVNNLDQPVEAFMLPIYFQHIDKSLPEMRAAVPLLRAELGRLEAQLQSQPWLCGDSLSAADFATYPMIRGLARATSKLGTTDVADSGLLTMAQTHPSIESWKGRIEALPYYQQTYPPHWRT